MVEHKIEPTDHDLVKKALEDQRSFGVLMEKYEGPLMRYIMRLSNVSRQEAEDILQDTFIKAYYNLRDVDPKQSFSAWLYRIAHNQTISSYRKRQSRPQGHTIDVDDDILNSISTDFDLDNLVDVAFLKESFNEWLPQIDMKYREVLILRFFQEKSYKEIAEIIRKPEGTVATYLNRAKKQLRTIAETSKQK